MKKEICIVNYEIGNQASLMQTLNKLNYKPKLTFSQNDLRKAELIILPGVGTFSSVMSTIEKKGISDVIKDRFIQNKPILGVCVGMQVLANYGYENKITKGLKLISGEVKQIPKKKVHIGWNNLQITKNNFLNDFNNKYFYFNHSYYYISNKKNIKAIANHIIKIPAIIQSKNSVIGVQFHPEKSQIIGIKFLEATLNYLLNA